MQVKMVKPLSSSFLYLFMTLFLLLPCHAIPAIQSLIYGGCSPSTSNSTSAALLASLVNTSSHSSFGRATAGDDVGLFQCRGDLSQRDCSSCVAHSVSLLTSTCPAPSGGTLQLQGCYVTAPTTTSFSNDQVVVYKKFGAGGGGLSCSQEVLNGLLDNGGPYRAVVGPNGVMAQAQCFQEITDTHCQNCVAAAVKVLTTREFRTSASGDVFMNNCYARYSCCTNTAYVARSAYTTTGSSDNGVKTFALIAGSLAGIVVLVIFLTFVCREFA